MFNIRKDTDWTWITDIFQKGGVQAFVDFTTKHHVNWQWGWESRSRVSDIRGEDGFQVDDI